MQRLDGDFFGATTRPGPAVNGSGRQAIKNLRLGGAANSGYVALTDLHFDRIRVRNVNPVW